MKELVKNEKLILQHVPNHGAWTYHIVIPDTKDLPGKWGDIKVSGTIDGYEIKNMNLAPVTNADKMLSVNGTIRKAINKKGGDEVIVTLYKDSDNKIMKADDVLACFEDGDVLDYFNSLTGAEQQDIIADVLSKSNETAQEKAINTHIKSLLRKEAKNTS